MNLDVVLPVAALVVLGNAAVFWLGIKLGRHVERFAAAELDARKLSMVQACSNGDGYPVLVHWKVYERKSLAAGTKARTDAKA